MTRKFATIQSDIEWQMREGAIRGGQKLPSVRELADRYSCSKSTVVKAYAELEKRHLVYSVPQSGYYAVAKNGDIAPKPRTVVDFATASPDPELFPYRDFQHCLNKAIDKYRNDLFLYGTPQGLPSFLNVLSKHLPDSQVFARPDEMVVTSGVQQALHLLATMPFPSGKRTVLLEQPGYHLLIRLLETHGIPALGIARDEQGIDLDRLESLFRAGDVKMFYTMPRFHNPLGTCYSERTKKAIAELAARYDVYVIEDDYLADLETEPKRDPIHAYDSSRTVYLKSFSKILFPGLRLGVAVLPPPLRETFKTYKQLSDYDSSLLSQAALEIYMQNGMFDRRRRKIAAAYHRRMRLLTESLDTYNDTGYVRHANVRSGVHTHLVLPEKLNVADLIRKLLPRQIIVKDSSSCFLPNTDPLPILKLSVFQAAEDRIEDSASQLMNAIKDSVTK